MTCLPKNCGIEIEAHFNKARRGEVQRRGLESIGNALPVAVDMAVCTDYTYCFAIADLSQITDDQIGAVEAALLETFTTYFAEVQHKSPTKSESVLSAGATATTFPDYVIEARLYHARPDLWRNGWLNDVPSVFIDSTSAALVVYAEDLVQLRVNN
jgi:hypothetical protein